VSCGVACTDSRARPDVSNVMSYYMPCRRGLSAEQMAVVEDGLELRRGWFRCLDPSACPCRPGDPGACPREMTCRPMYGTDAATCRLDGPALPGAPCNDVGQCSDGAVCLGDARSARCARACRASDAACTCAEVGLPFQICREDLD
jgi:hypothetical protein